ncbi:MAG: hypothetical protein HQK76_15545 [Desulfobacterales bacterium]|nr:hypothetical protein [Desulfobacterales bacterium]
MIIEGNIEKIENGLIYLQGEDGFFIIPIDNTYYIKLISPALPSNGQVYLIDGYDDDDDYDDYDDDYDDDDDDYDDDDYDDDEDYDDEDEDEDELTEEDINEMEKDDLVELIKDRELNVDTNLSLKKMRKAVIDSLDLD